MEASKKSRKASS
jgi:hypothetical protein